MDGVNHQWLVDLVIKNDTGQSYYGIEKKAAKAAFFNSSPQVSWGPVRGRCGKAKRL